MAEPGLSVGHEPLPSRPVDLSQRAAERVLCELVDALLAEDVLGLCTRGELGTTLPAGGAVPGLVLAEGERYLHLLLGESGRRLVMRVRPQAFFQPYRLSRLPVLVVDGEGRGEELDPARLMRELAEVLPAFTREAALPGLRPFLWSLVDAVERTAEGLGAEEGVRRRFQAGSHPGLVDWERLAALRDRPFHPTARAKVGWSLEDARRHGPESGRTFGVDWIAVRRSVLQQGEGTGADPASFLLTPEERTRLALALETAGLSEAEYLALPVHPWQAAHVLPTFYAEELASRQCVPVAQGLGHFTATASLRTLAPASGAGPHLKLPLGIESLGALRTLPPRYLRNGDRAARLLAELRRADARLGELLHLCDEHRWWAFLDPGGDLFADKPAHLACQLRELPAALCAEAGTRLVPMAALAVMTSDGRAPGLELLLRERPVSGGALALFEELCAVVTEVSARCFRFGVMPELHGQNALLVVRAGRIEGLLLRDHDTLRVHGPWLETHGFQVPPYVLKPNTPNTLVLGTPGELLGYFQTLAVQVNLYSIAEVLSRSQGVPLPAAWRVLRECLAGCLPHLEGPTPARAVFSRQLLEAQEWPFKCVLLPLLQRAGAAGTGMPGAMGTTRSPFFTGGGP